MGKKAGALLAVVAFLTLGACGPVQTEAAAPPTQSVDEKAMRDKVFLQMAHEAIPNVTDDQLLTSRKAICDALDSSPKKTTYLLIADRLEKIGMTGQQVGTLAAVGVASGCPEHEALIVKP